MIFIAETAKQPRTPLRLILKSMKQGDSFVSTGYQAGGQRWVGFRNCEEHIATEGSICPHCKLKVAGETMKHAADELTRLADELKICSTVFGEWNGTEPEAEDEYNRLMLLASLLTKQAESA